VTAVAMDSREQDEWIAELTRRKWTHFYFPNRDTPVAMASTFWHAGYVDVAQLFPEADAFAYRAPVADRGNPFTPAAVVWHYGAEPVWAIRAVLTLPEPGSYDAPTLPMTPLRCVACFPNLRRRTAPTWFVHRQVGHHWHGTPSASRRPCRRRTGVVGCTKRVHRRASSAPNLWALSTAEMGGSRHEVA
jgi:hypothetical protein